MCYEDLRETMGPQGVVIPDHQGKIVVILQNCSDVDVELPRGTLIGNIENSSNKEKHFVKDNELNQEELRAKWDIKNCPIPTPMSHQEKEEFLNKANIQVPEHYQQQYEDLLSKHHDVFNRFSFFVYFFFFCYEKMQKRLNKVFSPAFE